MANMPGRHARCKPGIRMGISMREALEKLRAALQDMKKAGVFKKALAAEAALLAAVALMEQMVGEIEELKAGSKDCADKQAHSAQ
jgi:hypothetical protein